MRQRCQLNRRRKELRHVDLEVGNPGCEEVDLEEDSPVLGGDRQAGLEVDSRLGPVKK